MPYRNQPTQDLTVIPKKKRCWFFFHKWVYTLKDPFDNFKSLKTIDEVACLQCTKCGKQKDLKKMHDVLKAQELFPGEYGIRTYYISHCA